MNVNFCLPVFTVSRFYFHWVDTLLLAFVVLGNVTQALADDKPANKPDPFDVAFAAADKDGDQRLTLAEFLENRAAPDAAKRDFKIFDLDSDGFLDRDEFASVPNVVEGKERGPLPDPLVDVLEPVIASLDKALGGWDEKPKAEIQSQKFFQILNARFASSNIRFDARSADTDGNGKINRDEARRFLEMQFGIRRGDGQLMRKPDGRVSNYPLFLHLDQNKNSKIERAEYLERAFYTKEPDPEFYMGNANGDDHLSFEEWWLVPQRGYFDPVVEFQGMDTNLDGFVSPEELKAGTTGWKEPMAKNAFPGFDLDKDGKFSLVEFRLTPQANMMLPWNATLTDNDGDEALSFVEFQFDPNTFPPFDRFQFPLLRFTYFHMFDLNGNGKLEPNEYVFKRRVPDEFFVMNEDGTGWKSLFRFEGHSACGSVAVSPDGNSIAFDSWPAGQQQGSAIHVMKLGTDKPRELCSGMMPTWSKDSLFLACSRSEPQYGVWMVEVNGDSRAHVQQGWGAQFSPDGTRIVFTNGADLKVYNFEADKDEGIIETILDAGTNPYQQIFWNSTWSPDGKRLCFKGSKADGTQEVASVEMIGEKHEVKLHYASKTHINADFAWHPTQNRIVFAMLCNERGFMQLYEFDPTKNDPPKLMKGQDETRNNTDVSWMPDGKQLIIVSGDF